MEMKKIKQNIYLIISHKAFQNFTIIGIIAIFQLINNVILGRHLEKEQFGQYSFVFLNISGVLPIILLFGHNSSLLRYFSSKDFLKYQWKKYLLKSSSKIIPLLIPLMLGIKIFYNLDWFWFWMGVISSFIMYFTNLISSLLRSKGYFLITTLLERAHSIIFSLLLSILVFYFNFFNIKTISISKLISYSVAIPIILLMLFIWKEGTLKIDKKIFKNNIAFWELNLSVIVLSSIDSFFIAKILSFQELALFSITLTVLQLYEFARISLFHIYSQKFSQDNSINIIKFNRILIIITISLFTFYMASTSFILNLLFHEKYTLTLSQLILFCLYSSINFLYLLPSCYVIGQSSNRDLRFMLGINLSSIGIKIGLIMLLSGNGLSGFLLAGIIAQLLRTSFGYHMIIKNKKIKWNMLFKLNIKYNIKLSQADDTI